MAKIDVDSIIDIGIYSGKELINKAKTKTGKNIDTVAAALKNLTMSDIGELTKHTSLVRAVAS